MRKYELVLILKSDEDKVKTQIKKIIKEHKGKVLKEEAWGEKEFAYPIKKEKKGKYLLLNLELPSKEIKEFNQDLRLKEQILRFLIIKTE